MLAGHLGMAIVCEWRVNTNPRLLGGGPGGAGSPFSPGGPWNPSKHVIKILF